MESAAHRDTIDGVDVAEDDDEDEDGSDETEQRGGPVATCVHGVILDFPPSARGGGARGA